MTPAADARQHAITEPKACATDRATPAEHNAPFGRCGLISPYADNPYHAPHAWSCPRTGGDARSDRDDRG